jgi:fucose permease
MIFSSALLSNQDKSNEISGIMIMGLIGGSIFPLFMGILSDALGSQVGSVIIISVGVLYLAYLSFKLFSMQKS